MRHLLSPAIALLLLLVAAPLGAQVKPDFETAKRDFKRDLRRDEIDKRRAAIRLLRATEDPRAVKEMITQLHICGRDLEKVEKKMRPMVEKRAKVRGEYDARVNAYVEQNPNTSTLPAGLVQNLITEIEELDSKLAPLEIQQRTEANTYRMLSASIGDLISSLAEADQQEQTKFLLDQYDRARDLESKTLYLEILGQVHNKQAGIGLVGVVANDDDPALRVAALDALRRLGDPQGVKAARFALQDEHWPVRAAAVEAATAFPDLEMIPLLIGALGKEDGRLKGDLVKALGLLSGTSFADNVPLWEKWWRERSEKLGELMADVEAESEGQRALGLQKMEAEGFLLAASRFLDRAGLSAAALRRAEARRLVDPEVSLAKRKNASLAVEADPILQAVGRAIGSRDELVRRDAFDRYVLTPYGITFDPAARLRLIELIGHVGDQEAAAVLLGLLRKRDDTNYRAFERLQEERARQGRAPINWRWNPDERLAAIRALGFCAGDGQVDELLALFNDVESDAETLLHAARALAHVDSSSGVRAMVRALGEIAAMREERKGTMAGVAKTLGDALRKATGLGTGDDAGAWLAWWNESGGAFKTAAEKARAENPEVAAAEDQQGTRFYGIRTFSKRIVFILDISGSMNEKAEYESGNERKIDVAKRELDTAIASLPADALFDIVFYSTEIEIWKKTLVTADAKTKKEAKSYVAGKEAGGGTNIHEPLVRAFDLAGRGAKDKEYGEVSVDTIFFLSDGQPTAGAVTDPEDILREVTQLNKLRKVQIHTIGVGRDHHREFMRVLAESSGGQYIAR
ncbi:MAG: HEAT repeat domain-containing protein [Planctomycetes bacterium]|nr:HEAT repeat domain-containing protein [Planctomycetota bacterium]